MVAAPKRDVPTTAIPITAPPRKPAINDFSIPCLVAVAVFIFAIVAILIPIKPAKPERAEPKMYAITRYTFNKMFSDFHIGVGKKRKINNETIKAKIESIVYSLFKNVKEPFLISFPIEFSFLFPVGYFDTQ